MPTYKTPDVYVEEIPSGVRERTVVIVDDMIATGSAMLRAVKACRKGGAAYIILAATHGLFLGGAQKLVASSLVDRIIISDTIPPFRLDARLVEEKVTILSARQPIAAGIRNIVAV